jgi:DNA helicase-2/ATP-dependent DNA helicase PcrA
MAASRMGFIDLFEPLYKVDSLRTGLTDGSLGGLNFFRDLILPLVRAGKANNEFEIARVIKQSSFLLDRQKLRESTDQIKFLKDAKANVDDFLKLWENGDPKLIEVLYKIAHMKLFTIPDSLAPIAARGTDEQKLAASASQSDEEDENQDEVINAWDAALSAPFSQLEQYHEYMSEKTSFDTHQGVKGLEFHRVMVVLDDEGARGFLFSYEKLLGAAPLTTTDKKNIQEGKETTVDRTRRLFYVTCSRAEKSLAIVAYTKAPTQVGQQAISQGWFEESEIVDLNQRT